MGKQKYAIFTMDVEAFSDTGCISSSKNPVELDTLDGFDAYIRILDKHGIKGTLFTVGSLAPQMEDRLKSAMANGHRLALHGLHHTAPMDQPVETFRQEIATAKDSLSQLFQTEISGYRAPFFSLDRQRLDVLQELGFKYDSSNLDFRLADHTVKLDLDAYTPCGGGIFRKDDFFEFSMSKQKIPGGFYPVSGGGYLRLLLWWFIKPTVKRYIKHSDYYVFYLHPFELTSQKIPLCKDLKFRDKYYLQAGIRSYGKRIEWLIRMLKKMGYSFVTFEDLQQILSAKANV